ncbi:MAG: hypothetical protein JWR07_5101 [Nevskia sp.]|nr:hypothetical protein [Nevskia sp.]
MKANFLQAAEGMRITWRRAFEYANRSNAIEGLPPPSPFGLQIQRRVINGQISVDRGAELIKRYYKAMAFH